MNVSKNITEGRAHIGVIQGNVAAMEESITGATTEEVEGIGFTKTAWSKPLVYVDDGYFGTLHINERMGLTTYLSIDNESDSNEWLPCKCQAGWNDMDLQSKGPLR
jgi:hypothetical protein